MLARATGEFIRSLPFDFFLCATLGEEPTREWVGHKRRVKKKNTKEKANPNREDKRPSRLCSNGRVPLDASKRFIKKLYTIYFSSTQKAPKKKSPDKIMYTVYMNE